MFVEHVDNLDISMKVCAKCNAKEQSRDNVYTIIGRMTQFSTANVIHKYQNSKEKLQTEISASQGLCGINHCNSCNNR